MARENVKGHTGILKLDGLPIVCLTSTSASLTAETIDKVNYCTDGEIETSVSRITEEISIDGEIMGGTVAEEEISYEALRTAMLTKEPQEFELSGRGDTPREFMAVITSLSDNFTAGEDATFSATIVVQPNKA